MLDERSRQQLQMLLQQVQDLDQNDYLPEAVQLPALGSWPECVHRMKKHDVLAIVAAVTAGRPLLVKGEPGVGKSHMARAAASLLERHFFSSVVQPHSSYKELMWTIDHTARLGDAQLLGSLKDSNKHDSNDNKKKKVVEEAKKELAIKNYLSPGPLWWAYDWSNANSQVYHVDYQPEPEGQYSASGGVVLLIDEIDKADLSLANGLLEVLGNGGFSVPYLGESVRGEIAPLVVITSNNTRELPKAFIRRCVVHELSLPQGDELHNHLLGIGKTHYPDMSDDVIKQAAELIIQDREAVPRQTQIRTGQAEFVDLLRALNQLEPNQQTDYCHDLSSFFFKHECFS